ncbi:hypothetical protein CRG98_039571 [Punica granatum]|uniref:TF-B3 domain-containing protein n=1 Tax=Punica granatum TaxID=22663 RepID=A0A2I0I7T9_PUNGR|nr:hypothetical protein CRG98_039571 [Punica granatum]
MATIGQRRLSRRAANYLARGWPAFVKDHGIQRGHFLLFKFDGETTFKVMVFSPTACEDKAAFSSKFSRGNGKAEVQERAPSTATNPHFIVHLQRSIPGRRNGRCKIFF